MITIDITKTITTAKDALAALVLDQGHCSTEPDGIDDYKPEGIDSNSCTEHPYVHGNVNGKCPINIGNETAKILAQMLEHENKIRYFKNGVDSKGDRVFVGDTVSDGTNHYVIEDFCSSYNGYTNVIKTTHAYHEHYVHPCFITKAKT